MARYLIQVGVKPEAMAAMIQNPHDRLEATRPVFERMGATVEQHYFGVGEDMVYVVA